MIRAYWPLVSLNLACYLTFYFWGGNFIRLGVGWLHPGRLTWNLQITRLERKIIFQTSIIMFHVNLRGCSHNIILPHVLNHAPAEAMMEGLTPSSKEFQQRVETARCHGCHDSTGSGRWRTKMRTKQNLGENESMWWRMLQDLFLTTKMQQDFFFNWDKIGV